MSCPHCSSCRSNVCRSPPPRSRLPVWVARTRPRRVKAGPRPGGVWSAVAGLSPLDLALIGVVDLLPHTGGTFTHLAFPFLFLPLDIEGLSYNYIHLPYAVEYNNDN
jgi:hypothetical protein